MSTKTDVKKALLSCLRANLKAHGITDATLNQSVDAYHSVLKDMEPDTLEAAVTHYISSATFFPTPGDLRKAALDLQMIALGIPTAGEAWAQVNKAERYIEGTYCENAATLHEVAEKAKDQAAYWKAIDDYGQHIDKCKECETGGYEEKYDHQAVKATVEMMGGLSRVFTGNLVADRARFQDNYKEVIAREKTLYAMPSEVKGYIDRQKQKLIAGNINQLTEGMKKQ